MSRRILSLMLAAVLMLAAFIPAAVAEEAGNEKTYYVYTNNTGKALDVHIDPNGDVIGTLEQGSAVQVISFINDAWAAISFNDGQTGYVSRRYLIDVDPEELARLIEAEKEAYTGDPMTDITAEFESAVPVSQYKIIVRPARATSWVEMRWLPGNIGPIIATYRASAQLVVLQEMTHYLQVQDPDTGAVGYIHKMFGAKVQ